MPAPVPSGRKYGFGVFPELLGCLEDLVEGPVTVVFAVVSRIVTADLRAVEINAAAVLIGQVIAAGHDQQVPLFFLDVDQGAAVSQVPADRVVLVPGDRVVDREREIAAATAGAVIAQALSGGKVVAPRPAPV